ncbi:hypothetical protein [Streptomyces sp. OP7]|uniref:hypothetical protein n=1 Tax=Streptomyces sp. OP7 TaxID=3142462 RepID=UPI0032E8F31B
MADTTRITVTLPAELVAAPRELTDDVPEYVAEAAARELRRRLVEADLQRHQEERGAFTEAERMPVPGSSSTRMPAHRRTGRAGDRAGGGHRSRPR